MGDGGGKFEIFYTNFQIIWRNQIFTILGFFDMQICICSILVGLFGALKLAMLTLALQFLLKSNAYFNVAFANFSPPNKLS